MIMTIVSPLLEGLTQPIVFTNRLIQNGKDIIHQQEELVKLRDQNMKLLEWQAIAKKLKYENKVLRKLVKLAPYPKLYFITVQVISSTGDPFSHSIMINAGSKHGIKKDQAVITYQGLVGRVMEVGKKTSRVMLITDVNTRIPAVLETNRARAIIAGTGSKYLEALYLPKNETVHVGERVVSSFEGGVFPPNIVIGRITSIKGDKILIKPFIKWNQLEFVQVIQQEAILGIEKNDEPSSQE